MAHGMSTESSPASQTAFAAISACGWLAAAGAGAAWSQSLGALALLLGAAWLSSAALTGYLYRLNLSHAKLTQGVDAVEQLDVLPPQPPATEPPPRSEPSLAAEPPRAPAKAADKSPAMAD
jgi:hypothetical protein